MQNNCEAHSLSQDQIFESKIDCFQGYIHLIICLIISFVKSFNFFIATNFSMLLCFRVLKDSLNKTWFWKLRHQSNKFLLQFFISYLLGFYDFAQFTIDMGAYLSFYTDQQTQTDDSRRLKFLDWRNHGMTETIKSVTKPALLHWLNLSNLISNLLPDHLSNLSNPKILVSQAKILV